MSLLELKEIKVHCPYCGETFTTAADTSVEQQNYIEDCEVCCSPIVFDISIVDDEVFLNVNRDNE